MHRIPVLMYHQLENEKNPSHYSDPGDKLYTINTDAFDAQMKLIAHHGIQSSVLPVSTSNSAHNKIIITFDDGHTSDVTLALPILKKYNLKAYFFITSAWIDSPHYLSEYQIQLLASCGMPIGSHGNTHKFYNDMNFNDASNDLNTSVTRLECIIGNKIDAFSAPGGRLNQKMNEILLRNGVNLLFTSRFGRYTTNASEKTICRIAIKSTTTLREFERIILQDTKYYRRKRLVERAGYLAKLLLGNSLYLKCRQFALKFK